MKIGSVEEVINVEMDSTMLPNWINVCSVQNQETRAQITKESINFYDGFVTLQNVKYDRSNKKMDIEKLNPHNNKVLDQIEMHVDLFGVATTLVVELYRVCNTLLPRLPK